MARGYLGHVLLDRLAEKVAPASTALVLIDMQNDFVHADGYCAQQLGVDLALAMAAVVAPIGDLAAAARGAGVPVVYTKVVQRPDGSLASPVWLADNLRYGFDPLHCMQGTWGWEIVDELAPQPGDIVLEKLRRSAFVGTGLENVLRARGITSIVATGVAGSGCVNSTVRDAIERDFFTVVAADCVADGNAEATAACVAAFAAMLAPEDLARSTDIVELWS